MIAITKLLTKINWKIIIPLLLMIALGLFGYSYFSKLQEIARLKNNNKTLTGTIQVLKTKSGEDYHKINSLVVSAKELKKTNQNLYNELTDMRIKVKNVQTVSKLNYSYQQNIDKIDTKYITDTIYVVDSLNTKTISKYNFVYNNTEINNGYGLSGVLNIPVLTNKENNIKQLNQSEIPYITDVNINLTDNLTVVPVINYKRFLIFFRRPVSVTVNIKSSSNIFKLNSAETYMID